jgi:hypothetical protein
MRLRPALEVGFLLLVLAGPIDAAAFRVTVDLAGPVQEGVRPAGVLRLIPQGADPRAAAPEPIQATLALPGEKVFDLTDTLAWEIDIQAEGYWTEPKVVPAGARESEVRLRLFPTGTLRTRLAPLPGQEPPPALAVRFQTSPSRPGATELFQGTVPCPVQQDGRLECAVPAGRLDLRLRSAAHVPVYFWGVEVHPGRATELGDLRLQPGASVSGWIETADGGLPSAECQIELSAETSGTPENLHVEERLQRTAQETRPNERGFFQLTGVAPGHYTLKVNQPGFAPVSVSGLEVREGLEAQLLERIRLAKPVRFELALDPPLDPYGQPWRVRLVRRSSPVDPPEETLQAYASPTGACAFPDVPPGTYELVVLGDQGSIWHSEFVAVAPGRPTYLVQIPVLRIEGRVTRGGDPLSATFWLVRAGRRLRFDSDEEGRFQGLIAEEGTWGVSLTSKEEGLRITLAPVEVKAGAGGTVARVDVVVPDTTLEGEVVDESGHAVPGALVGALVSQQIDSRVRTDAKGEFHLHGLPAGPVTLFAKEEDRESGWVQTALVEGEASPWLRLVLRRLKKVHGRVVSPSGGLPGARILAWPVGQVSSSIATAMSGPGGDFDLEVPDGEGALQVLVLPPGFAFHMATVSSSPGRSFEIAVEPPGGTLVLEPGPADSPPPVLVHDGVFIPLQPLQDWARMQGVSSSAESRLVVPNMAAGTYSLCAGHQAIAKLQEGAAPPAACRSGVLSPLGELVLRAPE